MYINDFGVEQFLTIGGSIPRSIVFNMRSISTTTKSKHLQ